MRNVGPVERRVRVVLGLMLLAAAFFVEWKDAWEAVPAIAGIALLATGAARYCPINHLLRRRAA